MKVSRSKSSHLSPRSKRFKLYRGMTPEQSKRVHDLEVRLRELEMIVAEAKAQKIVAAHLAEVAPLIDNGSEFVPLPPCIVKHNACNEPCDMYIGPCVCGAWHDGTELNKIRKDHAAIAAHNEDHPGLPQGPCQCGVCTTLFPASSITP